MPKTNIRDLSFATFNLLNLQEPGKRTYGRTPPFPETSEGCKAYNRKLEWVGEQIKLLDAKVIGFQELWSAQALKEAFDRAGLQEKYDLVARDAPGLGKPQVALAVRKDRKDKSQLLDGAEWLEEFPKKYRFDGLWESDGGKEKITVTINKFSRPILMARIQPEGTNPKPPAVSVYVAHLKSKNPARIRKKVAYPNITKSALSHIRRVMEAGAIRAILNEAMRTSKGNALSPTAVLGDLNDDTQSVTNEMISGQPSYRVIEKSTAGRTSDRGLYSVERLQQYRSSRHVYYTHIYKHKFESLDHILVSEEFYDHSHKRRWSFREIEVLNDHLNRETKKELAKIGASDHGLVRAYFDWNPH